MAGLVFWPSKPLGLPRFYLCTLLVCILLIITTCSPPLVHVAPLNGPPAGEPWAFPQWSNPWEALSNLDVESFESTDLPLVLKDHVEAFKALLEGNLDIAETRLWKLIENHGRSSTTSLATELLGNLLLMQSQWSDYLRLFPSGSRPDDLREVLAIAFSETPEERIFVPSEPVVLPTVAGKGGQPMVEVLVNGVSRQFILDTGAQFNVISSSAAEAFGVQPIGDHTGILRHEIQVRPGMIDQMSIGDIQISNMPVMIMDSDDLEVDFYRGLSVMRIEGIIGWPILSQWRIEIDMLHGQTIVSLPQVQTTERRNLIWYHRPLVWTTSSEGVRLNMFLDTGADETMLYIRALEKMDIGETTRTGNVRGRIGGRRFFWVDKAKNLPLIISGHVLTFREMKIYYEEAIVDGRIGMDIATGNRILIDFTAGKFEVYQENR